MARKHVQRHVKKLQAHQKKHRVAIYRLMRKVAKADLKRGGAMRAGKKKKRKLGKWATGPIPKSGWPKKPAGMGKRAGAWWSRHKDKAQKVQAKTKGLLSRLWQKGKDAGKQILGNAADLLAKHSDQILDAGVQLLSNHIDKATGHADKYLTSKIDDLGAKGLKAVTSAGKKRGGGRMLYGAGLAKKKRGGMLLQGSGLPKRKKGGMMLQGSGLPKRKRKKGGLMLQGSGLPSLKEIKAMTTRNRQIMTAGMNALGGRVGGLGYGANLARRISQMPRTNVK